MSKKPSTRLTPIDVAPHAYNWNREELEEMKSIIEGLLAATESNPLLPCERSSSSRERGRPKGAGYFEDKRVNGCGPYRYLRYWRSGKRKSIYVGKVEE